MSTNRIEIGPCKCGGYGQVLSEEAEAETGVCHIDLDSERRCDYCKNVTLSGKEKKYVCPKCGFVLRR